MFATEDKIFGVILTCKTPYIEIATRVVTINFLYLFMLSVSDVIFYITLQFWEKKPPQKEKKPVKSWHLFLDLFLFLHLLFLFLITS